MKKIILFCVVAILCIFISGCSTKEEGNEADIEKDHVDEVVQTEPGIEGYVMKKQGGSILVVSSNPKDFSSTGGLNEFYNAIWVSNVSEEVEIGQKVKIWFAGPILESFPGQGEADKISIVPSIKPDGAQLSEAQAIKRALIKEGNKEITVIKEIHYDDKSDSWNVLLKAGEEKEIEIVIEDQS